MKKTLLILFVVTLSSVTLNAQVLTSEDFTTLVVGNIGTDLTGATAGQGGWSTYVASGSTNSANSNFAIANVAGTNGNVIQITGSNAATGTRYLWKDGLPALWTSRTTGNDIIEVEYDIFTGPSTTSLNGFGVYLYSDETTPKAICGMRLDKNATISSVAYTNVIRGLSYYNNAGTLNTYIFGLGASATTPQVTLLDNTWYRVGFSFNKTTGEIKWKGPGINGYVMGAALGLNPGEIDFVSTAGTANAVAAVGSFDNYIVTATSADSLLETDELLISENNFTITPNPATDYLTISNPKNSLINSISITDLNGRTVKQLNFDTVSDLYVTITDLQTGVYMLTINSDKGAITKKVIKL
jgi:hypothetical protein